LAAILKDSEFHDDFLELDELFLLSALKSLCISPVFGLGLCGASINDFCSENTLCGRFK
jgi:hypothetical protein